MTLTRNELAKTAQNHFNIQIQQIEMALYLAEIEQKVWKQMGLANVNPKMEKTIRENLANIETQVQTLLDQKAIYEKEIEIVKGDLEIEDDKNNNKDSKS